MVRSPSATVGDVADLPRDDVHQLIEPISSLVVPTVTYRLLFVLAFLADDRRRAAHVAATDHPHGGVDGDNCGVLGRGSTLIPFATGITHSMASMQAPR